MFNLYKLLLLAALRRSRQYVGYTIAVTLAVSTFFSFGFFMAHPSLRGIMTGDYANAMTQLFVIGQVGVAIFAGFFVVFFQRFLLRLRSQELSLLNSLGMTPSQLGRLVCMELLCISLIGLISGLILSFVQTTVLLLIMNKLLDLEALSASFSSSAIVTGMTFFGLLFASNIWLTWRYIHRSSAKDLSIGQKASQRPLMKLSKLKALAGIVALSLGYTLALGFQGGSDGTNSINIFPVAIFVSVGTYLFFGQALAAILSIVRRRTASGYIFLSASRLSYRIQDFSRIFTLVALLCAGALTLIGVALGIITQIQQQASSPEEHRLMLQFVSLVLFVFFFIGLLFFVAAASTLYVKLFTQLDEDRLQARSLERLGISAQAFQSMVWRELAVMIFMPAVVAIVHATVAMAEFTTKVAPAGLSNDRAWLYFILLLGLFLMIFIVFYIMAGVAYGRQVRKYSYM
jgi:hypothetical protein